MLSPPPPWGSRQPFAPSPPRSPEPAFRRHGSKTPPRHERLSRARPSRRGRCGIPLGRALGAAGRRPASPRACSSAFFSASTSLSSLPDFSSSTFTWAEARWAVRRRPSRATPRRTRRCSAPPAAPASGATRRGDTHPLVCHADVLLEPRDAARLRVRLGLQRGRLRAGEGAARGACLSPPARVLAGLQGPRVFPVKWGASLRNGASPLVSSWPAPPQARRSAPSGSPRSPRSSSSAPCGNRRAPPPDSESANLPQLWRRCRETNRGGARLSVIGSTGFSAAPPSCASWSVSSFTCAPAGGRAGTSKGERATSSHGGGGGWGRSRREPAPGPRLLLEGYDLLRAPAPRRVGRGPHRGARGRERLVHGPVVPELPLQNLPELLVLDLEGAGVRETGVWGLAAQRAGLRGGGAQSHGGMAFFLLGALSSWRFCSRPSQPSRGARAPSPVKERRSAPGVHFGGVRALRCRGGGYARTSAVLAHHES